MDIWGERLDSVNGNMWRTVRECKWTYGSERLGSVNGNVGRTVR